jgi:hypothetical protein
MTTKAIGRTALLTLIVGSSSLLAQALPTSQPTLLSITREQVKTGRAAEHTKIEAGWPAAYAKSKSPDYYLAIVSMTGANEVWFLTPNASNAAMAESMKRDEGNATLSAELDRLQRADAEVINDVRTIQAMGRSDLSYGAFPNLAMQRFWDITTWRVRPGHEDEWAAAAKAYGAAAKRAAPQTSYRTYEVTAGLPGPTFYTIASVASYGDFDAMMASGEKIMGGATPDEMAALQKFVREGLINSETQRFRLSAEMSYVSDETKAQDPAFWTPKRKVAMKP